MESNLLRSWLRLSKIELSPRKAAALLERFGSPDAIFSARESDLRSVEVLTGRAIEKVLAPEPSDLDRDLDLLQEKGIQIVTLQSEDYPVNLRQTLDPPIVLFVLGQLSESDRFSVGIVGSRRASIYGKSMAERIAKDLVSRGLCVVSGGARGIDAAAHKGAISMRGRTIAVLGCGIDVPYPREHKDLFDQIAGCGAVVSEYSPGTMPEAWRFPSRNRIISGLALGVLVIQAPVGSGALITAHYAMEQGKTVFALPGNVDDIRNQGSHALVRDGAILVESADQILQELGLPAQEQSKSQLVLNFDNLSDIERKLVELLSLQPKHMDQVIMESGFPAQTVTGTLTILEMKGIIKRVPGNAYVRAL
jgi:DNA processing protein